MVKQSIRLKYTFYCQYVSYGQLKNPPQRDVHCIVMSVMWTVPPGRTTGITFRPRMHFSPLPRPSGDGERSFPSLSLGLQRFFSFLVDDDDGLVCVGVERWCLTPFFAFLEDRLDRMVEVERSCVRLAVVTVEVEGRRTLGSKAAMKPHRPNSSTAQVGETLTIREHIEKTAVNRMVLTMALHERVVFKEPSDLTQVHRGVGEPNVACPCSSYASQSADCCAFGGGAIEKGNSRIVEECGVDEAE